MKVKSYMCIPLQLKDLPVTAIFLCPKCLDIVSQIEGWIDLMRQRIFDAHEGAILYPETPIWLQALSGSASRAKEVEVVAAVPPVAEEVVLGPPASLPVASTAAASPPSCQEPPTAAAADAVVSAGAKRKPSSATLGVSGVPPKKIAAAVAAAVEDRLASSLAVTTSPSPPCTSAAVRSAIDSLTTIMNVVQSQAVPKKSPTATEAALPHDVTTIDVKQSLVEENFVVKTEPASAKSKEAVSREFGAFEAGGKGERRGIEALDRLSSPFAKTKDFKNRSRLWFDFEGINFKNTRPHRAASRA